ncbi:MAG: DUF1232 domain-containing protein [Methylococcales bacterium]|nr:DUF1232 domain-containing protein [Methylococcales bacterium]
MKKSTTLLKNKAYALYLASHDNRTPLLAKIVIGLVIAYALSPIDLIPDFIPVIGFLDDLILLPIGIWLAIRLIPLDLWQEYQTLATLQIIELPFNQKAGIAIIIIWLLSLASLIFWLSQSLKA